ncbi:hypothetical protein CsSME_00044698 [Camellia sinensis var. sinensis]
MIQCELRQCARCESKKGRLNNLHSCGVVVRTGKNNKLSSELVCNIIGDRLRDKQLTCPTDVVFDLKKEYGLNVSYHTAWLGVEKARGEVYGDYHVSFDQLRWYADAVMHYNPGSYVNLDFEQSIGRFKQFFISFKACIDGFNHICPVLFLDGTFLKGRFKGNLLAATGKDGNKVGDPQLEDCFQFNVVSSACTLTFVSDRNIGLLESMPAHLQANLRDKLRWVDNRVRFGLMAKLRECQHWTKLKGTGRSGINNFLEDMPPKHWANAYFNTRRAIELVVGCTYKHNQILNTVKNGMSTAAESFNKWILDTRNYPITRLVDTLRNQIMTMRAERKVLATNWNGLICPNMESHVREAYSNGCTWIIGQSNEDIYEYKAAYFGYIQPIPTVDKPSFSEDDFIIYPPAVKRPPGRPKKNRIPSRGEKLSQIRCGQYGRMGSHNRKTCIEPI